VGAVGRLGGGGGVARMAVCAWKPRWAYNIGGMGVTHLPAAAETSQVRRQSVRSAETAAD